MATAKFDIKTIQTEAQRSLHATVGAADYAIETVKEVVAAAQERTQKRLTSAQKSVQRSVQQLDLQPRALRQQAGNVGTVVTARVDELSKDAKARRDAVEKRVAELQAEAQRFVTDNVETATGTYDELVKRGETVVRRFRNQPAAKQTVAEAKTTVAKAKTTTTQAKKTAKTASSQARATVKKSPAKKSAKATGTAAKKTAKSAAKTVS